MVNFYSRNERIRKFYYNSMMRLYKEMISNVNKFEEPLLFVKTIDEFAQTFQFQQYVSYLSKHVIERVQVENAKDWREAVFKSYKPNDFYKQLIENTQGQIQGIMINKALENAQLISSMPALWTQKATEHITNEMLKGRRSADITQDIMKMYGELSHSQAQLIARTEVSKTSTMLTQARSMAIGLNWYTWRTSKDARVRNAHDHMEGVLINFTNPPDPEKLVGEKSNGVYNAGETYNCRCYPEPVVDIKDIIFPCKVYMNGKIVTMRKKEFEALVA